MMMTLTEQENTKKELCWEEDMRREEREMRLVLHIFNL